MSKELTEQWKDGELKGGFYYLLLKDGTTITDKTVYIVGEKQLHWHYSSFDFVEEVIAPVPNYDKYHRLVFKANKPANPLSDTIMCYDTEREKEVVVPLLEQIKTQGLTIKRLQEQIDKANEAIDEAYWDCYHEGFEPDLATEYRKKYGLNANDDKYK